MDFTAVSHIPPKLGPCGAKSPVLLPFVMTIEACCILHEADWMRLAAKIK
jgi:hypothetical protein